MPPIPYYSWNPVDLASLSLRIVVGIIFVMHGYPKLLGSARKGFWDMLKTLHIPFPAFISWAVGALEFFGGVFLFAGILTHLVAALLLLEMFGVMLIVKLPKGILDDYEFEFLLLAALAAIVFLGGGIFAYDTFLF